MTGLSLDRMEGAVEVVPLDGVEIGGARVREPHRHDYHELIWVREGEGAHRLDGRDVPVEARTLTVIGRGQVHVFAFGRGLRGAVVRFGDEMVYGGAERRAAPGWLLAGRGGRTVPVPAGDVQALEGVIAALAAEVALPPDARAAELSHHLIAVLLMWVERWYDASRSEAREPGDADIQLQRRFAGLLERDFARHHDAGHYADALGVPPAALSRALSEVTGRSTKELVTDRVMLEAARLLRFTDLTVGEVAHRAGFSDPLYFSRAFKRHAGEAPSEFRAAVRGRG
jgi:AraC family transcriptional regulator, transcriptional activator of pobA